MFQSPKVPAAPSAAPSPENHGELQRLAQNPEVDPSLRESAAASLAGVNFVAAAQMRRAALASNSNPVVRVAGATTQAAQGINESAENVEKHIREESADRGIAGTAAERDAIDLGKTYAVGLEGSFNPAEDQTQGPGQDHKAQGSQPHAEPQGISQAEGIPNDQPLATKQGTGVAEGIETREDQSSASREPLAMTINGERAPTTHGAPQAEQKPSPLEVANAIYENPYVRDLYAATRRATVSDARTGSPEAPRVAMEISQDRERVGAGVPLSVAPAADTTPSVAGASRLSLLKAELDRRGSLYAA